MPAASDPQPASAKRRILLVDDHPIVRQGLAQQINQQADLVVCGEAEDARTGFEAVAALKPDLVVVDLSLRNSHGLDLIKNLLARQPELPILVMSMHDETLYAERVLRAGARGYLMKEEAIGNVLLAIRRVLDGEIYVSDQMSARLVRQQVRGTAGADVSPVQQLSDRELEVFRLLGEGRGTREIAEQLHLSVKTVETYRANIMEKLGLKKATELVQHAFHWVHRGDQV